MKKILSLFLTIVMLLSLSVTILADSEETGTSTEESAVMKSEEFHRAAYFLKQIGVIDNSAFSDENITRKEIAVLTGKILGITGVRTENQIFEDVVADDVYRPVIESLATMGIISGYSNGRFGPDDAVSKNQAVKILVNALGYRIKAEAAGGFPVGYMIVAKQLDITAGITSEREELTKAEAVILFYNALLAQSLQVDSISDKVTYTASEETTLLYNTFKIKKYKGQITRFGKMTLYNTLPALPDKNIEIDSNVYNLDSTKIKNIDDCFGMNVEYFVYDDKADVSDVVAVYPESDNQIKEVYWKDVISSEIEGGQVVISCRPEESDKVITSRLSLGAALLVNDRAISLSPEEFTKPNSTIKLIDTDDNGTYDIALIKRYVNMVVDMVAYSEGAIYGKYASYKYEELDDDSPDYNVSLFKNGNEIGMRNIKEWDILSIYIGGEGRNVFKKVVDTSKFIEGTVEEVGDEEVFIDGNNYKVAYSLKEASVSDPVIARMPEVGDSVKAYFDVEDKIAAFDYRVAQNGVMYGYMTKASISDNLNKTVSVRIFDQKSNWGTYTLEDKITFNGVRTEAEDVYASPLITPNGEVKRQLVKLELDSTGTKVKRLDAAVYPANETEAFHLYDAGRFTINALGVSDTGTALKRYYSTKAGSTLLFNPGIGEIEDADVDFIPTDASIVFVIPPVTTDTGVLDNEDLFSVGKRSLIPFYEWSVLSAYDVDKTGRAAAIVKYATNGKKSEISMVDRFGEIYDQRKNEKLYVMYVMTSKGEVAYKSKTMDVFCKSVDGKFSPYERGDNITVICDMEDVNKRRVVSTSLVSSDSNNVGEVVLVDGNMIRIKPSGAAESRLYYAMCAEAPYYDTEKDKVLLRKTASLREGTVISYSVYYGGVSSYTILEEPE